MSITDLKTAKTNLESTELCFEIAKIDVRIEELKCEIVELQGQKEEYMKFGLHTDNTNSLTHFLKSDLITFGNNGKDEKGVELYCREKVFVAAFYDHCRESHFIRTKWTSQFYSKPFADFNIRIVKQGYKRYPNKPEAELYEGIFFIGVDLKENHK